MADHKFYGDTPADELKQTIAFAIWHAADRETGSQQMMPCANDSCIAAPPFDVQAWRRERNDVGLTKRRHLAALRLAVEVGQDPAPWVTNTREVGKATWAEIAGVLGVTRQAAQMRFGKVEA